MKLQERLRADAAKMEACGAGNEARTMWKAAAQLDLYEAALREIANHYPEPTLSPQKMREIARTALNSTDTGA